MTDSLLRGVLATLSYAFVMSITGMTAKLVQEQIPLATLLFWQSCICLLILLPHQAKEWQAKKCRTSDFSTLKIHALRSISGFLGFYCYYWALNYIPLMDASLLRASAPLCVPFVVLLVHKVGIPIYRWLPLLVGFVGVTFIIKPISVDINPWHIVGFCSAIGLAFSMVTTRLLSKKVPAQETLFMYFLISAGISLVLLLSSDDALFIPWRVWPLVLVVGITLYVGMYLYTMAYSYAPASVVSPVSYSGVVFSGIWGWLLWQDTPDIWEYLGMLLILTSLVVMAYTAKVTSSKA